MTRVEPDGIVLKTKSGISKVYFVELPNDVQQRFHYNAAIASAYSAQQTANQTTMSGAGRGEPITVISHGAQVDMIQHLAFGNVTVVDFYADWCGPCGSVRIFEQMAKSDPRGRASQDRHRELENRRCTTVQRSLDSSGECVRSKWPSCGDRAWRRFRKNQKLRRAGEIEPLTLTQPSAQFHARIRFNSEIEF